jgi:alkanesulfonate monooxygenase SsuD/methylene tetrahydromethanopterin reductase-like flavin-dependent oxidoreductase (luciferase family)
MLVRELPPEALTEVAAAVGSPEVVRRRIAELVDAGADHVVLAPSGPDPTDQLARLADTVLARGR